MVVKKFDNDGDESLTGTILGMYLIQKINACIISLKLVSINTRGLNLCNFLLSSDYIYLSSSQYVAFIGGYVVKIEITALASGS